MRSENNKPVLRLLELDGLRGIACTAVVVFHYFKYLHKHYNFKFQFSPGVTGVDLFFIISGFVIYMTLTKTKTIQDFILSRFTRLYPVFWFAVTLTTLLCIVANYTPEVISVGNYLANMTMFPVLLQSPYIDNSYWTLVVELQFYCLVALFYFGFRQYSVLAKSIFLLVLLFCLHGISIYFDFGRKIISYFPITGFWSLFLCGILFYNIKAGLAYNRFWYFLFFMLSLAFVYLTHEQAGVAQFYTSRLEHTLFVLGYLVLFWLFSINKLGILSGKLFVFLGSISYSVYLLHQTIGYILIDFLKQRIANNWLVFSAVVLIILVVSYFTNTYVEKPAMRVLRNLFKQTKPEKVIA